MPAIGAAIETLIRAPMGDKFRLAGQVLANPDLLRAPMFPSYGLVEQLRALPQPTLQPTELIGQTGQSIAALSQHAPQTIILSGGISADERAAIQQAATMPNAKITILEDREPGVLRTIDAEFLNSHTGQLAFSRYLTELLKQPHLLIEEYHTYLLGHQDTSSITHPLNTHYLVNFGLEKIGYPENPTHDPLRDRMVAFVQGVLDSVRETSNVFNGIVPPNSPHPHLNREDTQLVLMLGLMSNFLRGGVFYGFRESQNMKYPPRQIAYSHIAEIRELQMPLQPRQRWARTH
ncbi:MAG: hypothetical protein ACREGI_00010 [Candidatus Levyibacteriota bacterium]